MSQIGHVKACHDPRRDMCPHNADLAFNCDCVSERKVTRKPYRTVRAQCPEADRQAHKNIVAMIRMDNGLLTLRLKGKRKTVSTTLLALYTRLTMTEAMNAAKAKRKARRGK